MKHHVPIAVVAALGLGGLALPQAGGNPDDLKARVSALEAKVTALEADAAATKTLLEETVRYLAGRRGAADRLLVRFDESERAGFTAGINYRSREILLAGLRDFVESSKGGIPSRAGPEAGQGRTDRGDR